jgi:hypothetical protein
MAKKLWPPYWHYPRATEKPLPHGKAASVPRRAFFRAALINFAILQVVFLSLFAYIFGSLYQQAGHTHNMKILYVDYDGTSNQPSTIGSAVSAAYQQLRSTKFPTLVTAPPSEFPISGNLESAVCGANYWAAIYTSPGASARLQDALAAGGAVAESYNRSDVLTYIWNEARYSVVADPAISSNLLLLSNTARVAYTAANGISALKTLNSTDEAALSVFSNPWQLTSIDIQPTTQGSRAVYNTLVIILILIQEFFYLGIINGLYASFKIYARVPAHRIIFVRNLNSVAYCLVGLGLPCRLGCKREPIRLDVGTSLALRARQLPGPRYLHYLGATAIRSHISHQLDRPQCHLHSPPVRSLPGFLPLGLRIACS